jgi:hyperosmotically inducible protein
MRKLLFVLSFLALLSCSTSQKVNAQDNTVKNRTAKNYTAQNQSNERSDIAITSSLRKAIMSDRKMSVNAQNVKIITENGSVTLRGPVNSLSEKERIAAKAHSLSGVSKVINQLEVLNRKLSSTKGKEIH